MKFISVPIMDEVLGVCPAKGSDHGWMDGSIVTIMSASCDGDHATTALVVFDPALCHHICLLHSADAGTDSLIYVMTKVPWIGMDVLMGDLTDCGMGHDAMMLVEE